MTAHRVARPRIRWKSRYLGGSLGVPTPWFDCTDALEWESDPKAQLAGRNAKVVLVVSARPPR